jgi:hypothetical protein
MYTGIKFVLHFLDITQGSAVVLTSWIPVPSLHGNCSHSLEIPYTILYQLLFSTRILNPPLKRISCCTHQLDIPSSIRFESAVVRIAGIFHPPFKGISCCAHHPPLHLNPLLVTLIGYCFLCYLRIRCCPHTTCSRRCQIQM